MASTAPASNTSGAYAGMLTWTATAPWGKATHPDFATCVDIVMKRNSSGLANYLIDSTKTSSNEVPL